MPVTHLAVLPLHIRVLCETERLLALAIGVAPDAAVVVMVTEEHHVALSDRMGQLLQPSLAGQTFEPEKVQDG